MGQILHGSATTTTTEAVRRAIQVSQEASELSLDVTGSAPRRFRNGASARRSLMRKWFKGGPFDCPDAGRGSAHCRLPAAYPATARRWSLCFAADRPASETIKPASLLPAAGHRPSARHGRRQAKALSLQGLPDRLLSHRHRRGRTEEGRFYCSSRSTARPSSPSSNCTRRRPAGPLGTSCGPSWRPSPTRPTPC